MWPFKKKEKKKKPEVVEKEVVPEKTYAQWKQEYNQLEVENAELEEQCAKDGLDWMVMLAKTKVVKEKMAKADKMMRLLQEPSLVFNKKWNGVKMELGKFVELSIGKEMFDRDGEGYYATETAKTDIIIRPSDIIENIYRKDFPYVIWFPNKEV